MSHDVAFEIRCGRLCAPDGVLLHDLAIHVPASGVTAILGPAGCGKSKLLQALHGSLNGGWRCEGEWTRSKAVYVPQQRGVGDWRPSFAENAGVHLLLDEIDRAAARHERVELAGEILTHARSAAVVLVTHDLAFARAVAHYVYLIVDGVVFESGTAEQFFEQPHQSLTRRFIAEGNCWPEPPVPELPAHFRWIIPGKLAGMGRPGLLRQEDNDLFAIAVNGITLLVSLTERPIAAEQLRAFGIAGRHFPITDMGVPALGPTARLCRSMEKAIQNGEGVAVHCHAGLGRTGTILAAFLVWQGVTANEAIQRVREAIDGAIQTPAQAAFVRGFEAFV